MHRLLLDSLLSVCHDEAVSEHMKPLGITRAPSIESGGTAKSNCYDPN